MADLIEEQKAYYEARAGEYDEWWNRRRRYDLGPDGNRAWGREAEAVVRMLDELPLGGEILEFAGGTGIWSTYLARRAKRVVVLDVSPAMTAIGRAKLDAAGLLDRVEYRMIDLFAWKPSEQFDHAFAGFWVSHIPEDRLDAFFTKAAASLKPGGIFMILEGQTSRLRTAKQGTSRVDADIEARTLNDGTTFHIVKREIDREDLIERLGRAGLQARVRQTAQQFQLAIARKQG
ncbi:MAG: class I SAM-dependent methyltransferase [Candidatus Coatesbacteria bacterium]